MLGDVVIGQYLPGDSLVHRLDPRVKIVLVVLYMALVFVAPGISGLLVVTALTCCMIACARIPLRTLWRSVKPLLFIIVITFLINVFFVHSGDVLVHWAFITITTGSLHDSTFLALRLLLLLFGVSLLTLTTSPLDLCDGGERLMRPLARIGFPAHEVAMMMSIVLRFIPVFVEEGRVLRRSQETRGADFSTGSLLSRARSVVPLLVPMFASALRHADGLSQAMESRCYHGGDGRTRMHVLVMHRADHVALALSMFVLAAFIAWRVLV
jgi:energy-coupling factor transport system permease protein